MLVESGDGLIVKARHGLLDDWGRIVNRFDSGSKNSQAFCTQSDFVVNDVEEYQLSAGDDLILHRMTVTVVIFVSGVGTLEVIADRIDQRLGERELKAMRAFVNSVFVSNGQ